jgi:hypothetical protein
MHTKINVTRLEIFTVENKTVLHSNTHEIVHVFLVNMTLDKTPLGKTTLDYMSIYEENRWWNTASTKYR